MSPLQELVLMLQQTTILMDQLMASVAPAVAGAGMQLWQGLALIVVVWTGAQMALSGHGVNMAASCARSSACRSRSACSSSTRSRRRAPAAACRT